MWVSPDLNAYCGAEALLWSEYAAAMSALSAPALGLGVGWDEG